MVLANCRAQFTADDFHFVVKVLAKSPQDAVSLVHLLSDPDTRDQVLDHDLVFAALVDELGCIRISPSLYFYVVTRRVLKRAGIEERALCDYIASILVAFSKTSQLTASTQDSAARHFYYISDMLETLSRTTPEQAFAQRCHIGDYSLFFSGIFADRVQSRVDRRGAPGIDFYENIGQACYGSAARHPKARETELRTVLEQLADQFRQVRQALNRLTEHILHVHEPEPHLIRLP